MSEYNFDDDDDDFANFDLDAAVKSYTPSKRSNIQGDNADTNKKSKTPKGETHPWLARAEQEDTVQSPAAPLPTISAEDEQAALLANEMETIPMPFQNAVTQTLQRHFGHSTFRPGQLTILHSIMGPNPRDVCVFMATGAGKSLSFTLPPLHLNQVAIVVTPLVSLMQDQCSKLNGRAGGTDVATFLGSSQMNPLAEERALRGEFRLVYLTPEKLVGGGGGFLERLARMHNGGGSGRICLIAVDESHCVSEWGHDFRKEFLQIGPSIRSHPVLSTIPLLALTATAVPRVQLDIRRNLRMHPNATIAKRSFDRPNLKISIKRKPKGGHLAAFEPLAKELARKIAQYKYTTKGVPGMSTIVYASTKNEVEAICASIVSSLAHQLVRSAGKGGTLSMEAATQIASSYCKAYHAGLSHNHRAMAHESFLIGKTAIIVATVAFGMGIDKPDIRKVIHWGGCKTVEEYYQQMGRAGRDGLKSECIMFADAHDFTKYNSDFYLGSLSGEAKEATIRSTNALKNFAMSTNGCRRASLLNFFDEKPSFGDWCGTCDLCFSRKNYVDDYERDFQWEGARVLLVAIAAVPGEPITIIEKVISGTKIEQNRFMRGLSNEKINSAMILLKSKLKKKRPAYFFKEFLPALIDHKYVNQQTKKTTHKYSKAYNVYTLTDKGYKAAIEGKIILPVPVSIREAEQLEEARRKKELAELEAAGVDLKQIPDEELAAGEGEALAALKKWFTYIDTLQKRGFDEKVNQLDDLKSRIEGWRLDMAERYRMAPGSVMEDHLLVKVAYAAATLPSGTKMESSALEAAGVRSNGIDELTKALGEWSEQVKQETAGKSPDGDSKCDAPMTFKPGEVLKPANSWRYATYKPAKKTGLAAWESSYNRFRKGEHLQTIAMTQQSGKPIQIQTVQGHILDGLVLGREVDLHHLASFQPPPPTKSEWENLARCELETGMKVTGDPATSGANGETFRLTDFLVPIMGNEFVLKDRQERTPEENAKFGKYCYLLKWYLAFRRVGYEPSFA